MDAAGVRIVLGAIADGNTADYDPSEVPEVVAWMRRHVRLRRPDKGGGEQYDPEMEAGAEAAQQAADRLSAGDIEGAKPFALEALKAF
jgi:hypothetical protein